MKIEMKQSAVILGLALSAHLAALPISWAGTKDGGGGTVIFPAASQDRPMLLDLYLAQPNFRDTYRFQASPFKRTSNIEHFKMDQFDIRLEPAYALVQDRLAVWNSSSPALIKALQETLQHTFYRFTFRNLGLIHEYSAPSSVPETSLKTAVFYHPQIGAVFSAPIVNQMGDASQAGLIIHEALRQIQMAYGESGMSNQLLQEVTAQIVLSEPGAGETLDVQGKYGSYTDSLMARYHPEARAQAFCAQARESAATHPEVPVLGEVAAQFCPDGNPVSSLSTTQGWRQAFELLDDAHDSIFGSTSQAPRGSAGRAAFTNLISTALANSLQSIAQAMEEGTPDLYQISTTIGLLLNRAQ